MTRLPFRALLVVVAVGSGIGIVAACSNQGEGEVCNTLNGSDDCQTDQGLACFAANVLNNTDTDRCCPEDRSKATHPACTTYSASVIPDGTAPSNTGPDTTDSGSTLQDAQVADAADAGMGDAGDASDAK